MMWLMPIKTAHRSMLWPGTHRKQGFLPAASCTGSWHVRAAPSLCTEESVNAPRILHYTETQKPFCVAAVVSPPSAWLTKPRCITTQINLELCPLTHCPCKSFSPSCRSSGAPWLSEWLCYSRCVWLSFQGVCLFLSLTHFFSLPFFFPPLFLSPSTSQAFSVELYSFIPETLWVLFRDVSAQNAHTQSTRRRGRGRASEKLPCQTALLSFTSATNKRQSFFLPIVCER